MKYVDNKCYLLLCVLYCDWLPTLPQYPTRQENFIVMNLVYSVLQITYTPVTE